MGTTSRARAKAPVTSAEADSNRWTHHYPLLGPDVGAVDRAKRMASVWALQHYRVSLLYPCPGQYAAGYRRSWWVVDRRQREVWLASFHTLAEAKRYVEAPLDWPLGWRRAEDPVPLPDLDDECSYIEPDYTYRHSSQPGA